jgi:hypothetical protein
VVDEVLVIAKEQQGFGQGLLQALVKFALIHYSNSIASRLSFCTSSAIMVA